MQKYEKLEKIGEGKVERNRFWRFTIFYFILFNYDKLND